MKLYLKDFFNKYVDYIGAHGIWLTVLCGLSWCSLIDIAASPVFVLPEWIRWIYPSVVGIFKGVVLLTALYPFLTRNRLKWIAWAFCIIYAALAILNVVSYYFYDLGISRKLILIIAQTTPYEANGFLPGLWGNMVILLSSAWFYFILALLTALTLVICRIPQRIIGLTALSLAGAGLIALGSFAHRFSSGRSAHLLTARIMKYSIEVWRSNKEYEKLLTSRKPLPHKESVQSKQLAKTVIVVIGESAHRRHHSLYGYKLPTTPHLDSMADSLVVFTDAIGSSAATSGNMERILSFKQDDLTMDDGLKYPLVVDLFKEMGYKTFWLSNQERTGTVSNTSGVMAMNANTIRYVGADNSEDALNIRYDEALLPSFTEALHEEMPKMIFLHLLGSHTEYNARYPEAFNYFTAEDEIRAFGYDWLNKANALRRAEYDNSIRYTDSILDTIITEANKRKESALVVYLSDHGEEVYDFSAYTGRNDNTVQVPFVIYANQSYARSNPELMMRLRKSSGKPLSTANLVHLLITLTGGQYYYYDSALDIASDDYRIKPRYVDEKIWRYDIER